MLKIKNIMLEDANFKHNEFLIHDIEISKNTLEFKGDYDFNLVFLIDSDFIDFFNYLTDVLNIEEFAKRLFEKIEFNSIVKVEDDYENDENSLILNDHEFIIKFENKRLTLQYSPEDLYILFLRWVVNHDLNW